MELFNSLCISYVIRNKTFFLNQVCSKVVDLCQVFMNLINLNGKEAYLDTIA